MNHSCKCIRIDDLPHKSREIALELKRQFDTNLSNRCITGATLEVWIREFEQRGMLTEVIKLELLPYILSNSHVIGEYHAEEVMRIDKPSKCIEVENDKV